jgi:hypothetical protein
VTATTADFNALEAFHLPFARDFVGVAPGAVDLFDAPGGARVATIHSTPENSGAVVIASRGGYRRIAWLEGDLWLVGWLPPKFVRPHHERDREPPVLAMDPSYKDPKEAADEIRGAPTVCGGDVPFDAQVGGQRVHVGRVRAGSLFGLGPAAAGVREVHLEAFGLAPVPDAKLVTSSKDLAGCDIGPAP